MLQNTTHFNQEDFRALNFMTGLEKTHGTIKLKHVERDFHIVYDPMKPSKTHFVLGEMRMVKRKMTPRPKDPIKIKVRSAKDSNWELSIDGENFEGRVLDVEIFLDRNCQPRFDIPKDLPVGEYELNLIGNIHEMPAFPIPRNRDLNCKMVPMEGRPCKKKK